MKRAAAFIAALLFVLCAFVPSFAAEKLVALSFDDGPGLYTEELLDVLGEHCAKATFFVTGKQADRFPETVKREYEEGHQVASHTYSHANLTKLGDAAIADEMAKSKSALDSAIGTDGSYMLRPPYGGYDAHVLAVIGVPAVYWSLDTKDWKTKNAETTYNNVMNSVRDGDVILMHDLYEESVAAVGRIIEDLQEDGYSFVTVEELFERRGVSMANGTLYARCPASGAVILSGRAAVCELSMSITEAEDGFWVELLTGDGSPVYYSTDGSTPTQQSQRYQGVFNLAKGHTLRAASFPTGEGFIGSEQKMILLPSGRIYKK